MHPKRAHNGFTLIEMMIVLAIMGGIVALSMPYISSRNAETKKFLRQFTVLSRELHTRAKLQGVAYRLVINLQDEPGAGIKPARQSFWVEKGNAKSVLKANEEEAAKKRAEESDESKRKDPKGFELDKSMIKSPTELPLGMTFEKVELSRLKAPLTRGKAFIHYLPQGLVDEAAIHIKGEKRQAWTVIIHPLTGKAELIPKPVTLEEVKTQ